MTAVDSTLARTGTASDSRLSDECVATKGPADRCAARQTLFGDCISYPLAFVYSTRKHKPEALGNDLGGRRKLWSTR